MANCRWTGVSGWGYDYGVYPLGTTIINAPGNYILTRLTDGFWHPLYIGEAQDLGRRCCATHEKWAAAIRLGATHIHLRFNPSGRQSRLDEETDLRRAFNTPLNTQ